VTSGQPDPAKSLAEAEARNGSGRARPVLLQSAGPKRGHSRSAKARTNTPKGSGRHHGQGATPSFVESSNFRPDDRRSMSDVDERIIYTDIGYRIQTAKWRGKERGYEVRGAVAAPFGIPLGMYMGIHYACLVGRARRTVKCTEVMVTDNQAGCDTVKKTSIAFVEHISVVCDNDT